VCGARAPADAVAPPAQCILPYVLVRLRTSRSEPMEEVEQEVRCARLSVRVRN
jgi:hypothetical protein